MNKQEVVNLARGALTASVAALEAVQKAHDAVAGMDEGTTPAPQPEPEQPPAQGGGAKQIDWQLTGMATEAYAKATGRWVQVTVYSDGTREGPEIPKPDEPGTKPPTETKPDPVPPAAGKGGWSGIDKLRHQYGHVWNHDGQLDVSSWAGDGFQPSGAMQKPNEDGQGYGVYTYVLSGSKTNAPGKFACVWPKPDKWYWEIDVVENDFNGNAYATLHYGAVNPDGSDGKDQSIMKYLDGIRADDKHTYELTWSRDLLVIKVDGAEKARFTEHVPRDASDGGCDGLMGVGTQPAWAAQVQTGDNVFTVHDCYYRPLKTK